MKNHSFFRRLGFLLIACMGFMLNTAAQKPITILPAHVVCDYKVVEKAETQLRDKMLAALTAAGLGNLGNDASVALLPSISVIDEKTAGGVQSTVTIELNYTFTLVNINSGVAFDSFVVPGVMTRGQNKENAVARSFASINLNTPEFHAFLLGAQSKVLGYYERNVQQMVAKAQTFVNAKQYEDALEVLMEVPEETPSFTTKVLPVVERVYQSYARNLAASLLQQAQTAWATSPDEDGAEKVAELLSRMPVGTPSSAGAQKLVKQIEARLKTLDQRKWAALNRELARNHQERMATIKAARDVAVAYAKRPVHIHQRVYIW
jgi:hypothetical protein